MCRRFRKIVSDGGQQGFQIAEGLAYRHQRPGDDEFQDVLLAFPFGSVTT